MTGRATRKPAAEPLSVTVSAAKGRPMLSWVGKRPLGAIIARPAQHMETFAPVFSNSGAASTPPHK